VAHARARLTVHGRRLLVERVLDDGWRVEDAAKAMGVSRQTGYKWIRRYRSEGVEGLRDRSSAPSHCPHRLGDTDVQRVVAARLETLFGPHRLADRRGMHRSTIYGVLRREGLHRLSWIDRPTRTVAATSASAPASSRTST
jgi:transposase